MGQRGVLAIGAEQKSGMANSSARGKIKIIIPQECPCGRELRQMVKLHGQSNLTSNPNGNVMRISLAVVQLT
jgi:hypothetical protein